MKERNRVEEKIVKITKTILKKKQKGRSGERAEDERKREREREREIEREREHRRRETKLVKAHVDENKSRKR